MLMPRRRKGLPPEYWLPATYEVGGPVVLDKERERILLDLIVYLEEDGGTIEEFCKARGEWRVLDYDEARKRNLRHQLKHGHGSGTYYRDPPQTKAKIYCKWYSEYKGVEPIDVPISEPMPWYQPIVVEPERWQPPEEIEGECYLGHPLHEYRDDRAVCAMGHEA